MNHKKIFWQIFPAYIFIVVMSLVVVLFFSTAKVKKLSIEQKQKDLESMAMLVAERVPFADESDIDKYCETTGSRIGCRITIVAAGGKVLGDTERKPQNMDNHIDREEIKTAFTGQAGITIRFSDTLKKNMLYVAVPMYDSANNIYAVARVSVSNDSINEVIDNVADSIIKTGFITALVAAVVSLIISRQISRPLAALRDGALRFKAGNLEHRLAVEGSYESATLAVTMNNMAYELDRRIKDITQQRTRQQAILSSMTEAVVAVDNHKIVIMANEAAMDMFNMPSDCVGRSLEQAARHSELHSIVDMMLLEKSAILNKEITIFKDAAQIILQTHATMLTSGDEQIGVLVVLNNVTQIKKLENIRKEFVANVSHELKTPITSIKGFVETLRDGAINDTQNAVKFLDIISRQTLRLESIIEDLLALSRIEQLEDGSQIELQMQSVKPVLAGAVAICRKKADDKSISINMRCDDDVAASLNRNLLEQAVVNLIDNAIKYSDSGAVIDVSAALEGKRVVINVKDSGCGIPQAEFPRLFERFYRVDKARSRDLGGTGLGLSIVKHIVNAHKGSVTVESKVAVGSTFTIKIPV